MLGTAHSEACSERESSMCAPHAAKTVQGRVGVKRKTSRRERPARRREIVVHSSELRIAQLIEHTLITREPAAPAGWSIGVHYEAAKVVGGDFYDVVPLANGWWALL